MKLVKIIKYSLMTMLLFVGLFLINSNVYAKDVVCNYSFDFTYDKYHSDSYTYFETAGVVDFQLVLDESENASGWEGYTKYQLKVTGDHPISLRYRVGNPNTNPSTVYLKNSGNECPQIVIYQRRSLNLNIDKFYLISENGRNQNETAQNLLDACIGKTENDEVLSGYRCGNIIGPISGAPVKQVCTAEEIAEIKDVVSKSYGNLGLDDLVITYSQQLQQLRIDATSASTKDEAKNICYEYIKKANSYYDTLESKIKDLHLSDFIKKAADDKLCIINDQDIKNISDLYDGTENGGGHDSKLYNYSNTLYNVADARYNECVKAANISIDDQNELIKENKDKTQELREESALVAHDIRRDHINYINKIILGSDVTISCNGILGQDLVDFIDKLYGYIQIAAPILLIILGIVDFSQAVISNDQDALKKATNKFVRRAIVCVIIFFVPLVINILLNIAETAGLEIVDDPLCGIK